MHVKNCKKRREVVFLKKFSIEHPFFEFMGSLGDWMILNVLFVVTCLPVITIGTSLTAIYQVSLRRIRKESRYAAKEYIQAFRQEWKGSTKLWMIFLCTGGILPFDVLYGKNLPGVLNIAIGCLVVLWMFSFTYAFPLQARFKNSIKNTIINAFYLAFRNLPVTLLMAALNCIPVICAALGEFVVMASMPVFCIIGFALIIWLNSLFLTVIFDKFIYDGGKNRVG